MFALLALVAVLHLSAQDNNKTFSVKPRTTIIVTLASNPSTGYHWINRGPQSIGGRAHLRTLSHRYVPPTKSRPGAGGKEIWRFRATGNGRVGLWLQYVRRPNPMHAVRAFAATIHVR